MQIAVFSPDSRPELLWLLDEAWQRAAGITALRFLHLRVRLLGWPKEPVQAGSLAGELAVRLGGLESPPPGHLPQLLRAAELLADADPDAVATTAEGAQCVARVRERLQTAMWLQQIKVKERAGAGIALARVGDLRPGVGCRPAANGTPALPDLAWVDVAGGEFVMGSGPGEGYNRERPQMKRCTLVPHGFKLARYPVTVAQFAAFVAAGGYAKADGPQPAWWTDAGWQWRVSEKIEGPADYDSVFQTPNHPRVGVSWFEADAFARWLNQHRAALGLPTGWGLRLPTEAEWERAARGTDGRNFPWGDESPDGRCNYANQIWHTSVVGLFRDADAEEGAGRISDQAGNVLEWCATKWLENYEDYESLVDNQAEGEDGRVVRGGAWLYDADDVRASYRIRFHPGNRSNDLGFRLAASPIPLNSGPSGL